MNGAEIGLSASGRESGKETGPLMVMLLAAENGDQSKKALLAPSTEGEIRIRNIFSDLRVQLGINPEISP